MISQALCDSFKAQVLLGVHDLRVSATNNFRIALYTADADLGPYTTQYTTQGECVGAGYTAGGRRINTLGVSSANGVGFASFANRSFPAMTLVTRGALIYNAAPSALAEDGSTLVNPAVCVLDFGEDKVINANIITIVFPVNASNTAIVRIA